MRKRILQITIALFSLLGCTACFDIQENLFLKRDGSGNFSFIIDMEQMKSMMAMFDDGKGEKSDGKIEVKKSPNQKLNAEFEKTRRKLLNTEGISNVKAIEDTINFKFGIVFDFKNISALNKSMNKLFEDDTVKPGTKDIIYYEWKDNQLIRNDDISKSILGKTGAESVNDKGKKTENLFSGMDQLFATISYSTNYEFEDKIEHAQNDNSLLSTNMKKITLKCYPFAVLKDSTLKKCSIANTITFK